MKIIVTGGAGFIGSAVIRDLVAQNFGVINIDKLTYAGDLDTVAQAAKSPGYSFCHNDICDPVAISQIFHNEKPDAILHLAAESHVDRSIDGPDIFIQTNVVGTTVLLNAALAYWQGLDAEKKKAFRFVHVSTDEVYGALGDEGLFTEQTPYDPSSPYSASKAASDHMARAWQRTYGLPVIVTNCSNNYGLFQFPEKLIPTIIRTALAQDPIPVYGKGENVRDWLHVEDHARALLCVIQQGQSGETYNIGGHNEYSNIEVVRHVCAVLDRLSPRPDGLPYHNQITFVTDRPGHDFRYAIDAGKIERELGWTPQENFETGLEKTVQWYLDHKDWWQQKEKQSGRLGLKNI